MVKLLIINIPTYFLMHVGIPHQGLMEEMIAVGVKMPVDLFARNIKMI